MPESYSIEPDHPILQRLISGNKNWMEAKNKVLMAEEARNSDDFIKGQDPDIVVITCSDSRVIPEFIFDAKMGDLFVIRIAGNVITEEVVASVEFAVDELQAKLIVVLGHQNCGAVTGRLEIDDLETATISPNMKALLGKILLADGGTDRLAASVKRNAEHQLRQILRFSDGLLQATREDTLDLCAGIYSIDSREVEFI